MANEYLLAAEAGLKAMYTYTFPFIVFHGADDTLTDPDGSKKLYERSQVGALVLCLMPWMIVTCSLDPVACSMVAKGPHACSWACSVPSLKCKGTGGSCLSAGETRSFAAWIA